MTQDRKRKQAIRGRQLETGRRYTSLSREDAARQPRTGQGFTFGELLAECTSAPVTVPAWWGAYVGSESDWEPPKSFFSRLLGVDVPHGTILELAGLLAQSGLDVGCRVESVAPDQRAILLAEGRRFDLCLTHERIDELCRQPACTGRPLEQDIVWCREHLRQRSLDELLAMACQYGCATRETADYDPERCGGGSGAEQLVRAAVLHNGSRAVIEELISSGFDDPDLAGEWSADDTLETRLRDAIDRERRRLGSVAESEAGWIRRASEPCPTCGTELAPNRRLKIDVPPQYCSRDCVPKSRPASIPVRPLSL